MALFTDVVTIITKVPLNKWLWDFFSFETSEFGGYQFVVMRGVQWSEVLKRVNSNGVVAVHRELTVTFPQDVYKYINFDIFDEEMSIFLGEIKEEIADEKGKRLSDLLRKYPKSGLVKLVRDNSNRDFLKHVKVVVE